MEKCLIEIFGIYGKGDADKEVESFVVNSIDELKEAMKVMNGFVVMAVNLIIKDSLKEKLQLPHSLTMVTGTNQMNMKLFELLTKKN